MPAEPFSTSAPQSKGRKLKWALIAAGWTLIVFIFAAQSYLFAISRNRKSSFPKELLTAGAEWYIWAALTPLVLLICRRFRINSKTWLRRLPIHLVASLVFSAIQLTIQVKLTRMIVPGYAMAFFRIMYFYATSKLLFNLLTYWLIVLLEHGLYYYEQSRTKELAWARMESDLANAQLQVLNMQLHPHFLFNTLHSISTLISEEPAAAQEMVLKLGDLLRASLQRIDRPEVSLQQEIELLDCYLTIEQTRFKDRLTIEKNVDLAALECNVPTMVLQPLVENAVRHGIGKHKQADRIRVSAQRENGRLVLEVRNSAGKMEREWESIPLGTGLKNTLARLEQLYNSAHSFEIANNPEGGVTVRLSFPATSATELRMGAGRG